ncbi:MAG: hypothetical protein WAU78_16175 [Roseiarcus sp.]|jgi:hypothetical protein
MQRQAISTNDKRTLHLNETAARYDIIRSAIYVLMTLGSLFFHRGCPSSRCFHQELRENLTVRIAISNVFDKEINVVRMGVPLTPHLSSPAISARRQSSSRARKLPGHHLATRPSPPAR